MDIEERHKSLSVVLEEAIAALETDAEDSDHRKSVETAVDLYKQVKDATDSLEAFFKRAKKKRDLLKNTVLPELFEARDVTSITRKGYRFTVSYNVRANIRADMKIPAYTWLRLHDYGDLITETVNASTLSATAKAMAEDGEELNDEYFNTFIAPSTSVTKAKQ